MTKAHQRILRDKVEQNSKHNLFNKSLYINDANIKESTVKEINFTDASKIIMKYEWLQSMPHRFGYRVSHGIYFNKTLGGALVYAQPQVRSKNLFGRDYGSRSIIQLSRGACSFWTPSGSASRLISQSLKILKSEGIIAVVAYCTPEAGEFGTIYQACNFIYYGKTSSSYEYFVDKRWIGERSFAHKKKWLSLQSNDVKKEYSKSFDNIKKRKVLPRFKYIKILNRGANKRFQHDNLDYPKREDYAM